MARKLKITISVDDKLLTWLDKEIEKNRFWSRSHGFSLGLAKLMDETLREVKDVKRFDGDPLDAKRWERDLDQKIPK